MPGGSAVDVRGTELGTAGASAVTTLASLPGVQTASGVATAAEHARTTGQVLPVLAGLAGLLPWGGLRRGSTVSVRGSTSLLLALLAEASAGGAWAAAVGLPNLGVVAAGEIGIDVGRLALVPRPGAEFAAVTAALLDGVDLVAVGPPVELAGSRTARRLSARARHRGSVLLCLGSWPGADVELSCGAARWSGLAGGYGYLRERHVVVHAAGRGAAAKPVRTELTLPCPGGSVAATGVVPVAATETGSAAETLEEVG